MRSPQSALLWLCWQRARSPLALVLSAVFGMTTLLLVYLDVAETEYSKANVVAFVTMVGIWMLGHLCASRLGKSKAQGVGFPLLIEFSYPVSTIKLTTIPFFFLVTLLYSSFAFSSWLLCSLFSLPALDPMIHFIVLEYLIIVTSVSWATNNGYESACFWIALMLLFFPGWLIPDFSFNGHTGEFIAGSWSSALAPAFLAASAFVLLLYGVRKQRSGEGLLFSSGASQFRYPGLVLAEVFRGKGPSCPVSSAKDALAWEQNQFRGARIGVGMGATIGVVVILILSLLSSREGWIGPMELDDVMSFAVILFCSIFVGHLASSFGVSYVNGAARIGTFHRTLPVGTATLAAIRLKSAMQCVLIAGITELVTIGLLGFLVLDNFAAVFAEFVSYVNSILDQGLLYGALRLVLLACLIYISIVLWAVFISWFAIKSRQMAIVFSGLAIYVLLVISGLVVFTEGSGFLDATRMVGDIHAGILSLLIIVTAGYLFSILIREEVLSRENALLLLAAGIALAFLQFADLNFFGALDAEASVLNAVYSHTLGLLPLTVTVLALWTQHRIRHG